MGKRILHWCTNIYCWLSDGREKEEQSILYIYPKRFPVGILEGINRNKHIGLF